VAREDDAVVIVVTEIEVVVEVKGVAGLDVTEPLVATVVVVGMDVNVGGGSGRAGQ